MAKVNRQGTMLLNWIFYGCLAAAKVVTVTLQDDQTSVATTQKTCSCTGQGTTSSTSLSPSTDSSSKMCRDVTTKTVTINTCSKDDGGVSRRSMATMTSLCITCQQNSLTAPSGTSKEKSGTTIVSTLPQETSSTDKTDKHCTCQSSIKSTTESGTNANQTGECVKTKFVTVTKAPDSSSLSATSSTGQSKILFSSVALTSSTSTRSHSTSTFTVTITKRRVTGLSSKSCTTITSCEGEQTSIITSTGITTVSAATSPMISTLTLSGQTITSGTTVITSGVYTTTTRGGNWFWF